MQTTFKRACLALAVALGASAAFGANERPVNDDYWTWEPCPAAAGSGNMGNYRLKGSPQHQKEGLQKLAEALWNIRKDSSGVDKYGSYLHVIFTTNVTISAADGAYEWLTTWHKFFNGKNGDYGSLRIISELKNPSNKLEDQGGERYDVVFTSNRAGRIFDFYDNHSNDDFYARFIGITFTGGRGWEGAGGAVRCDENASFRWCKFIDCEAAKGGAISWPADADALGDDDFKKEKRYFGTYTAENCTFDDCRATVWGGAIYGYDSDYIDFGNICGCTFINCRATELGGALYHFFGKIERSIFKMCECTGGYGGAICGSALDRPDTVGACVRSCLFEDCKASERGGAISGSKANSQIFDCIVSFCTFIRCADKSGDAVASYDYEEIDLYSSLFYECSYNTDPDSAIDDHDAYNVVLTDPNYFYSYVSGDYHYNVCDENGNGGYPGGPKPGNQDYWNTLVDLDGHKSKRKEDMIAGCYQYYTKDEWMTYLYDRMPYEWETMDPLTVTTTGESRHNKDGVISFREAFQYLMDEHLRDNVTKHPGVILFDLSGTSRTITLTNAVEIVVCRTGHDLLIDGGDRGITLQHKDDSFFWPMQVRGEGKTRTFRNMTLRCGIRVDPGYISPSFKFVNCAFQGGNTIPLSGRVGAPAGDVVRESDNKIEWNFEQCSFSGYRLGTFIVEPHTTKTEMTFDACTFSGNSNPDLGQAMINGVGKFAHFRNCTFANNAVKTMCKRSGWEAYYPTEDYFNCILANSTNCPSSASSDNAISRSLDDVFETGVAVTQTVFGVEQIGYRPKHNGTARDGSGGKGDWKIVPESDVFSQQRGSDWRFYCQGSWYLDDRETPSLTVTDEGDSDDPYDDKISLREAINYAGGPYGPSLISGTTVRPLFSRETFSDGKVEIKLNDALTVANTLYEDYPLELQPGANQTLKITESMYSSRGMVQLGAKMKMRVRNTTFIGGRARNQTGMIGGSGGITSFGELFVYACRFDDCQAKGNASYGFGGALFLGAGSRTFVYDSTFAECQAAAAGGAIANRGDLVAINVTLTDNTSMIGSAVMSQNADRTLFANAAIVNNSIAGASSGYAFAVMDGYNAGLINSIVVGNKYGNLGDEWRPAPSEQTDKPGNWYAASLVEGTLADVFLLAKAVETNMPNGVKQSYYPLKINSPAAKGAFVFTNDGLGINGQILDEPLPLDVGYSTDFDGFDCRHLNGTELGFSGYVIYDQLGGLITQADTGMGPMPSFPREDLKLTSGAVNTERDVVNDRDNLVSLREGVMYAIKYGRPVNFDPKLFSVSDPVFVLSNQIEVAEGQLEIKAPGGHQLSLFAPASNRFFRVKNGAKLVLDGVVMTNGTARGIYDGVMSPLNDADGGAVCGVGGASDLSFANCTFLCNRAPAGSGGAIYAEGQLALDDCDFRGNSARYEGGAVYSKGAFMTMMGGEVADNAAGENGGGVAILAENATNVIEGTEIANNEAVKKGGGVYCGDSGQSTGCVTLTDAVVTGNRADPELSVDQNVFTGAGFTFNEQYVLRVHRTYYVVKKGENDVERVELSDEAAPVVEAVDLGSVTATGQASVEVSNVIPNLEYGLGRSESPVGPYVVETWQRATSGGNLRLVAPANGSSGFFKVMAREAR